MTAPPAPAATPRRRAVDAAAIKLRGAILDGTFPPRAFLPPERALAELLGLNRLTLRAALARLEGEGLIVARQGQGVRVQDWRERGGPGLLASLDGPELRADLAEAGRALLSELAAHAAALGTAADLERLDALALGCLSAGDLGEAHSGFWRAVAEAGGNVASLLMLNALAGAWRAHEVQPGGVRRDAEVVATLCRAVAGLVRRGDPDHARERSRALLAAAGRPGPTP